MDSILEREFILMIVTVLALLLIFIHSKKKRQNKKPNEVRKFLEDNIPYFQGLDTSDKELFLKLVDTFLEKTKITGIEVKAEESDKILLATGAVIPAFKLNWLYDNLHEVLLYPKSFSEKFDTEAGHQERQNILGMVGTGPMNKTMIISKPELLRDFTEKHLKQNVMIHECAHLIDKTDGETDGTPTLLLDEEEQKKWIANVEKTLEKMKWEKSDINPYAMENKAEFFAVISEYFFTCPNHLKQRHPDLFTNLCEIYKQDPSRILKD